MSTASAIGSTAVNQGGESWRGNSRQAWLEGMVVLHVVCVRVRLGGAA